MNQPFLQRYQQPIENNDFCQSHFTSNGLFIPRSFDIYDLDSSLNDDYELRIPDTVLIDNKKEYITQLKEIFRKIPKLNDLKKKYQYPVGNLATIKVLHQKPSIIISDSNLISDNISRHPTDFTNTIGDLTMLVYTFSIYNAFTNIKEQSYELLSTNSLEDLHQQIFCLHKRDINDEYLFVIEDNIYCHSSLQIKQIELINSIKTRIEVLQKRAANLSNLSSVIAPIISSETEKLIASNDWKSLALLAKEKSNLMSSKICRADKYNRSSTKQDENQKVSSSTNVSNFIDAKKIINDRIAIAKSRVEVNSHVNDKTNIPKVHIIDSNIPISMIHQLRFDKKYLYCHLGACEHFVYLENIHAIFSNSIVQSNVIYPRKVFQSKQVLRKCQVCDIHIAMYVTRNDRLALYDPAYFCEYCYHMLHYDSKNQLIYDDFQVFLYDCNIP